MNKKHQIIELGTIRQVFGADGKPALSLTGVVATNEFGTPMSVAILQALANLFNDCARREAERINAMTSEQLREEFARQTGGTFNTQWPN